VFDRNKNIFVSDHKSESAAHVKEKKRRKKEKRREKKLSFNIL